MRILSVGNFGLGWDGSICDEEHIAGALEELGHEVTRWQRDIHMPLTHGDNPPSDFILIAQWDGYDAEWLHKAKNYFMCPLVYWAFDYQADGQEWHERLVEGADLYLSKRIADSKYPNWQWLAQDFAPSFLDKKLGPPKHLANLRPEKDIDVLFTGSYLPWATERNETLKAVDEKFNLVIHSVNEWPGFKDQRGPIMDEGLPELYARAKVVLSIDHTIEPGYWSDRNAQIMACGGFVLFRYVPLSTMVFGDGVEYFHNVDECLNLISGALDYPSGRQRVADLGYERAHRQLMVKNRVWDLMTIVKGIL